jgi:hypothetical protein
MANGRAGSLMAIALLVLLSVQLTGLSCLDEWHIRTGEFIVLADTGQGTLSPDAGMCSDGCPCHLLFQSVSLSSVERVSPLTTLLVTDSQQYTPTLIHFLFHPPVIL